MRCVELEGRTSVLLGERGLLVHTYKHIYMVHADILKQMHGFMQVRCVELKGRIGVLLGA